MTAPAAGWAVEHHRGSAAAFHDRPLPEPFTRAVWWFEVTRPALVLGSAQGDEVVDRGRVGAGGATVEVVRRRSGGGAVWLAPGETTWVDVLVPAGDVLWDADVGRAGHWLGRAWARALARLGVAGAVVHTGPMVHGRWSRLVCFGGLGPGEVVVDGRKVVGLSQRRTRAGARFQCAVLHRWDPVAVLDLLDLSAADRHAAAVDLAEAAAGVDAGPAAVVDALLAELP